MTERSYPFGTSASPGTPVYQDEWSKMVRFYTANGVHLAVSDGLPYGDGTATIKVPIMAGSVQGHHYENDAIKSLTPTANASGAIRIDSVVLRRDMAAKTVTAEILLGNSASVSPTLTQNLTGTWEERLADIAVPNGYPTSPTTIAASAVTDKRAIATGIDGTSGSMVKLNDTTLGSDTATLADIQNIPQTFSKLLVEILGRGSGATQGVASRMNINNDTGTNYVRQELTAKSTTVAAVRSAAVAYADIGEIVGNSAAANSFGVIRIELPFYAAGSIKHWRSEANSLGDTSNGPEFDFNTGYWNSVAAINRLKFVLASGSFKAASRVVLHGLR